MDVIIDRFEGEFAVVEMPDMTFINVPRLLFPEAKESDVISISINTKETDGRKEKISELMDDLFND